MDIVYVSQQNADLHDEEGGLFFALRKLGHTVYWFPHTQAEQACHQGGDFLLCTHLNVWSRLRSSPIPKVFWYVDLVDHQSEEPHLIERSLHRRQLIEEVTADCLLGFMTDGDYVDADITGKLHFLPQGADERFMGVGIPSNRYQILVVGSIGHRRGCILRLKELFGNRLNHIVKGTYRRNLADAVASSAINVCPSDPVTDRYASNRVFVLSGFGGFTLHKRSAFLEECYRDGKEIIFYDDCPDLREKVDYYLAHPGLRRSIAVWALKRTWECHTYRHRAEILIKKVREALDGQSNRTEPDETALSPA